MSRKQFLAILAVLAGLAAAAAGVVWSDRSDWKGGDSRAGQRAVAGLRISDVAEIAVRDSSGELHLVRGQAGWSVRERADLSRWSKASASGLTWWNRRTRRRVWARR